MTAEGIVDVGDSSYDEATESGLAAYNPHVHGTPRPVNRGVTRIAGVGWLDLAECSWDDDPDAWQLDPSEVVGDPPVSAWDSNPADEARVARARAGCARCPVATECEALAKESETVPLGIWYGLTWAERGGVPIVGEANRSAQRRAAMSDEKREQIARDKRARMARLRAERRAES